MNRKLLLSVAGLLALLLAAIAYYRPQANVLDAPSQQAAIAQYEMPATLPQPAPFKIGATGEASVGFNEEDEAFLEQARQRFADKIHVQHARIKLIEQVIAYLKEKYPEDWQSRVAAYLSALFPDLAESLIAHFEGLMTYNGWLEANRGSLRSMSAADRRAALWAARYASFGDAALEIWAVEIRNQQIRDALGTLDAGDGTSVSDKLNVYVSAINEAWGQQAQDFMQSRQTELTGHFLSVEAVQQQLHEMDAASRNNALREIRQAMGMSPDALDRWSALDQKRDRQWDNGQSYMRERDRVTQQYDGEERDKQMQKLQKEHFGEDAETIRAEEASGFYRYSNQRRYGRE